MSKARTFVRPLTAEERRALDLGRKSADAFTVRRSRVLLAGGQEKGRTPRASSVEAVRRTPKRVGVGWGRAKHGTTRPDPEYAEKTRRGTD